MLQSTIDLLLSEKDFFIKLLLDHIKISAIAIILASLIGIGLGILISKRERLAEAIIGLVNVIYTIPSIALLGILITITGIGNTTAIIALTIYGLLPMVRSTYSGIKNINPSIIEAAYGMGATSGEVLRKIKIPLALPVIMTGLRNMVTMTIALAGIASFVGAGGLGVAIYRGITTNKTSLILLGSILVALLALVADGLLGIVEKRIAAHKKINLPLLLGLLVLVLLIPFIKDVFPGQDTIHIATKPTTENYITGQITKLLIEDQSKLKTEVTSVGGGTANIHPAMVKGDFDIYTEYTGTAWQVVLKETDKYDESKFGLLKKKYHKLYDMDFTGMYGFNNSYGLAVTKEVAEKYGLKTFSDLAKVSPNLRFGAEYDFFEREDGYKAIAEGYGFAFKETMDMDVGLKYKAIQNKEVDAMVIFTTDGQLSTSDIVVLEDDKKFYPSYMAGNVVRQEVLRKHPELQSVLRTINGLLDEKQMIELNYRVEAKGEKPEDVARDFLTKANLLGGKE